MEITFEPGQFYTVDDGYTQDLKYIGPIEYIEISKSLVGPKETFSRSTTTRYLLFEGEGSFAVVAPSIVTAIENGKLKLKLELTTINVLFDYELDNYIEKQSIHTSQYKRIIS